MSILRLVLSRIVPITSEGCCREPVSQRGSLPDPGFHHERSLLCRLSLVLALMLHGAALCLGLSLSRVLSGQDPQLLNQLTLELR